MKVLNSKELKEKINNGEKFIVDMYADWCGPCRVLGNILEKVSGKLINDNHPIKIYKFDIESDKETAAGLGVRSIPTILSFKDGQRVDTKIGVVQEKQIIDMANAIK